MFPGQSTPEQIVPIMCLVAEMSGTVLNCLTNHWRSDMHLRIPPPIVAVAAAALIWVIGPLVPGLSFKFPGQQAIAAGLVAIGVVLDLVCVADFFRRRTTVNPLHPEKAARLITSGAYRMSRNPMYLGLSLALLGWAFFISNAAGVLVVPVFMFYLTQFQIKPEEQALEQLFGADYHAYAAKVRRWL